MNIIVLKILQRDVAAFSIFVVGHGTRALHARQTRRGVRACLPILGLARLDDECVRLRQVIWIIGFTVSVHKKRSARTRRRDTSFKPTHDSVIVIVIVRTWCITLFTGLSCVAGIEHVFQLGGPRASPPNGWTTCSRQGLGCRV